jgi:hypothetical protein
MPLFQIRYNHDCKDDIHFWRVLINGVEHTASEIKIEVPTKTTKDILPEGIVKFHISCESEHFEWNGSALIIKK